MDRVSASEAYSHPASRAIIDYWSPDSHAAVAQWIEYWPPKPRVVGSIPASRAKINDLRGFLVAHGSKKSCPTGTFSPHIRAMRHKKPMVTAVDLTGPWPIHGPRVAHRTDRFSFFSRFWTIGPWPMAHGPSRLRPRRVACRHEPTCIRIRAVARAQSCIYFRSTRSAADTRRHGPVTGLTLRLPHPAPSGAGGWIHLSALWSGGGLRGL